MAQVQRRLGWRSIGTPLQGRADALHGPSGPILHDKAALQRHKRKLRPMHERGAPRLVFIKTLKRVVARSPIANAPRVFAVDTTLGPE